MKYVQWFIFPLALIAFLIPVPVKAQSGMTTGPFANVYIKIQVRKPDGSPAPQGILVELEGAGAGIVDQCTTGSDGRCQFNPRTTALYILSVRQPGYEEIRKEVDLRDIRGAFVTLDLKSKPGENESSAAKDSEGTAVSVADLGVPENARTEFGKGQKALTDNKVGDSISHFKKAIQLYASFPQAYTMLGTAYLQENDLKDAQPAFEKAIQLNPKSAEAFIKLGATFNQMKNYPEAEKALNQGLELNPEAVAGHYELAKTYMAQGRWQDAEPHAVKALAGLPDVAPVHVLMGNILLKKRDAEGALREFQEYLRLDPNGSMAAAVRDVVAKIQKALATQ
jgi:tetratricopeptide (TPR) repeat protein